MELINSLNELNNAAHHLVMGGTICFFNNLITKKKAEYLNDGVKYGLWKDIDVAKELKILNNDLSIISKKKVENINEKNMMEVLFNVSNFMVKGYAEYIGDKSMFTGEEPHKVLSNSFKSKRDSEFDIWLRFYFRLKGAITEVSDKVDVMTNYIG
jgi:hypothetical protein